MGTTTKLEALDGAGVFTAYNAGPATTATSGIVVIQEIFGINRGIRAMVDGWAAQGFAAIAPDLFWRLQPGIELNPDIPEEFKQALDLMSKFDADKAIADIEVAIRTLRAQGCTKVGVVGYCLGGYLAYLAATRTDSDASVGYYGVNIDTKLNEANAIGKPLMLHIATHDGFVPPEKAAKVRETLAANRHATTYDYDADHAFARHEGSSRVPALAEQADARTLAFFREHLA